MFKSIIDFILGLFKSNTTQPTQVEQPTPTAIPSPLPASNPIPVQTPAPVAPAVNYDNPNVKNVYPELPVIKYAKTTIGESTVVAYINSLGFPVEVKRATYIFFVNESAHGSFGINNNYGGIQADGARWSTEWDSKIVATTVTPETMTGNERRFCVFDKWESSIDLLLDRIQSRGIYIGGYAHPYANFTVNTVADFAKAYWQEWVEGDQSTPPASQVADIEGLYNKAAGLIS